MFWFIVYYAVAVGILILHFTGYSARCRLKWTLILLAATIIPIVRLF